MTVELLKFAKILLIVAATASIVVPRRMTAQAEPTGVCVQSQPGGCGTTPSPAPGPRVTPSYDNTADIEARAAAAAAAVRRADSVRAERARLAAEKLRKEAEFIRARDATNLRGSIGSEIHLRGGGTASTELRILHGSDGAAAGAPLGAWKQLHCAAALSGYAFAAITQHTPDYQESSFLLAQASRAMNGQSLGVECPEAPPFPDLRGRTVDMEKLKASETAALSRATVVVERLKQHPLQIVPSPSLPIAGNSTETDEEKRRRVQLALNEANSLKIKGKTRAEIDQQERDRKELAKLILTQAGLEKGELVSFSVDVSGGSAGNKTKDPVPTRRTPGAKK